MLPDQPRDANNLLRKVILGNIFNRFFTVTKVQPTLFMLTLAAHYEAAGGCREPMYAMLIYGMNS